ncbi:MAG: cyclopropane fatty acyl phospholipid synthase [Rickettsiales bacterium]|nr:cyclopropane fatty acyl phospholipid synthase [Rickettsiales bacterium]
MSQSNSYKALLEPLLADVDIQFNGSRPHDIRVHDERFYKRAFMEARMGLGESYMDGWWDCDDLEGMFFRMFRTDNRLQYTAKNWKYIAAKIKGKLLPDGSIKRSDNIGKKHYDIGNDLFTVMLDDTMMYTCGIWQNASSLYEAQIAKLDMICRKLKLEPGMTLLDVGCGWGALSKYAAEKYGVRVVGISVSVEQIEIARQRCAGLPVEIRFQDYRNVTEKFDRIAIIEMSEHVGLDYYPTFMQTMRNCLKDDGILLLQTGGINVSNYSNLWLTTYIFPGAIYPSLTEIFKPMEGHFVVEDVYHMGPDYHPTFMTWNENFIKGWNKIKNNYDERFYRMWTYYLQSTAAGFRARRAQVWQMVMTPRGIVGGYTY